MQRSYRQVLPEILGPAYKVIDIISFIMLAGGLGVMFAGSGAVLKQHFNFAIAGLICGAVIGISIFLITLAGLKFSPEIFNYDIPTLYMASVAVAAL